jgi:shikimate kinase
MKTNVALIGFMGVGKSAVGKILADDLKKKFSETDFIIAQKAGKTIPQIFREDGEIAFREKEIEVVKEIAGGNNQVIACGGGVVLNKINIDRLRQTGVTVWLTASPAIILGRIVSDGEARPLIPAKVTLADIRALMTFRKPYYQRASDIEVDTSTPDIEAIVRQIIDKLCKNADFN